MQLSSESENLCVFIEKERKKDEKVMLYLRTGGTERIGN